MMVTANTLRKFCKEMSQQYGIKIDCSFLDKYQNQNYWWIEEHRDQA